MTDKPTVTQADIDRAVLQWCGEKDRETSNDDIEYFEANWRVMPGLRSRVENLAAHREASTEGYQIALQEWFDKTAWLQTPTLPVKYLGMHRADILTAMVRNSEAAIKEAEHQIWAEAKALWYYGIKWENLKPQSKVSLLQEARAFLTSAKGQADE